MKAVIEKPKIFEVGEWVYVKEPFTDELGTFERHQLVQIDKRTKVGEEIYLWSNGTRYPLENCSSPDFTDEDIVAAAALVSLVSDEPGLSQVRQLLAQICPKEIKPKVWERLSKSDQEKLKAKRVEVAQP